MDLLSVIVKPVFSEKSYGLKAEEIKKYMFEVNKKANKYEIALAFEMIYGIKPEKINIVNRKPTAIRTGTRNPGLTKFKKIAYITLPKGVDIAMDEEEAKETKKENK
ncbi:50S ribosomal protein L23 [Malacoplasma iowae]|uniref:50S ribosomal protein L23 n=1 Tax=Malacoplasma iowae TaxID=2116 RepID=UPI002A189BC5|nr:50S ribosomal protein L23 [Malacoplasma iowae]WPL37597.1 50S ribosomal protein L23 [Malacoplasma iowae]